jgi:hypothetical protein
LGFIFEPRAFAASIAFDFIFDFKTILKGSLPDTFLKVLLPDINLSKESSSLNETESREWPIGIATAAGGAAFFAIAFDFSFDSNPLQKGAKGAFRDTVLMDLLPVVNLLKELSSLDEKESPKTGPLALLQQLVEQDSHQQTQPHHHD